MAANESAFSEKLKSIVLQRAVDDNLVLPSVQEVIEPALAALGSNTFDVEVVARLLEVDPLTVARLLRAANHAAYQSGTPAITLDQVLRRIGARTLRSFLEQALDEPAPISSDPEINEICRGHRVHSLATATVARDAVTMVLGGANADMAGAAFLAGLLHDIGRPILASLLLDAEQRLMGQAVTTWLSAPAFGNLVATAHRTVGLLVAAKWEMPGLVRAAIGDSKTFDREHPYAIPNFVRLSSAVARQTAMQEDWASDHDLNDSTEIARTVESGRQLFGLSEAQLGILTDGLGERIAARTG